MDWITSNQTLIQAALIYAILGYSLQISLRAGVFSFAGCGFFTVGAYTTGVLAKEEWSPVVAIVVAMLASAVIGYGLSLVLSRLRAIYLAMATLAFIFIVKLLAESLPVTGKTIGLLAIPPGVSTIGIFLIAVAATILMWWLSRGRVARTLEAMRLDELVAGSVGIKVRVQRDIVFVTSAVLGALAGGLYALNFTVVIPDQVGFELIVTALTILVIGGSRHWAGVLVGAVVVAWLPDWLAVFGYWRPVVDGLVIMVLAVLASNGVVGAIGDGIRAIRRRSAKNDSAATVPERAWTAGAAGKSDKSVGNDAGQVAEDVTEGA